MSNFNIGTRSSVLATRFMVDKMSAMAYPSVLNASHIRKARGSSVLQASNMSFTNKGCGWSQTYEKKKKKKAHESSIIAKKISTRTHTP